MTGRPIIACIPNGAARDILSMFSGVYICEPENNKQIQSVINEIRKNQLKIDSELNRSIIKNNFIREKYKDLLIELCKKYISLC